MHFNNYYFIQRLSERTCSLWSDVATQINEYINPLYACNKYKDKCNKLLEPKLSPQSIELWRGLYFRYENGIHAREKGDDYLLKIHDHTTSLEDHAKLLVKRLKSLGHNITSNTTKNETNQKTIQPKNNCDNNDIIKNDETIDKTLIEKLSGNDDDRAKAKSLINQIEIELKSVALDWKSSSKVEECSCSITFDAFNKRVS